MKRIQDFKVAGYTWLNRDSYLIELESEQDLPGIAPGNFAEIKVPGNPGVFLRRPFSIFDVDYDYRVLSIFIKIIGEGTRALGSLNQGQPVSLIYPLGNTFSIPEKGPVLIIAGGSGMAPFLLLGKKLKERSVNATYLLGGRTSEDLHMIETFSDYGQVFASTEDGSAGTQGVVTDHEVLKDKTLPFRMIYTCGPDPMMKAVARLARQRNIPCEASLEHMMACGFGACLCCVTETAEGKNVCVCTEGPVFNVKNLAWQI
ncbi:MAG: dihydroorotate dehydrogenase electron transfer subunit [Bacteroidales bacterium]